MQSSFILRSCLSQRNNKNVISLAKHLLRSPVIKSSALSFRPMSGNALPEKTTGWNQLQYPVNDMLKMHWKAAITEDKTLERRRRIHLLKLVVATGVVAVGIVASGFIAFYLLIWDFSYIANMW
ncbi:hypothetical protein HDE_10694 [Halotydeus destructor]|nr:hypothetical protein HDE_10694 [Halotydeus destructor]